MLYAAFERKIEQEGLQLDPRQGRAVQAMEALFDYGLRVAPPPARRRFRLRFLWVLLRRRARLSDGAPRDLYLCGAVGRGKTMLMDLFFQELARRRPGQKSGEKLGEKSGEKTGQTPNQESSQKIVARFHFHAFMRTVHALLAQEREAYQGHRNRKNGRRPASEKSRNRDGLKNVARVLASQARLFCLDELEVKDVADALILNRLFIHLRRHGSAFIMTSNVPPRDLYRDGLQRELFLPFIDWLEAKADVLYLDAPCDYRLGSRRPGSATETQWLTPHTPLHLSRLQLLFEAMAMAGAMAGAGETVRKPPLDASAEPGAVARTRRSDLPGFDLYRVKLGDRRGLKMARHGRGVLWTFFGPLCGSALGRSDYLTLASRFQTFFLLNIPRLTDDRLDHVARFIWLIDILYDHGARLFATAEAPVHELYAGTRFPEFARTASRLQAMQYAVPLSSSPPEVPGIPGT